MNQSNIENDHPKFLVQEFELRDGRVVTLREPVEADAQALLDHLSKVFVESEYLVSSSNDPLPTLEQEVSFIRNVNHPDALCLIAEHAGAVVASGNVQRLKQAKVSHRATLGIAIVNAFRGMGLGKFMMDAMIEFCQRHEAIQQIELGVFHRNEPAIKLYERFGFTQVGLLPNAMRNMDGTVCDEILMSLQLEKTS